MEKTEKDTEESPAEPFENVPSSLDTTTHAELLLMHEEASRNLLFCKSLQWRSVGAVLLMFVGFIVITWLTSADRDLAKILQALIIVVCCGVVFVLIMYQFWQFNEISRLREIDEHFSTLYIKISKLKSRREASAHRYTILLIMIALVIVGGVVTGMTIEHLKDMGSLGKLRR